MILSKGSNAARNYYENGLRQMKELRSSKDNSSFSFKVKAEDISSALRIRQNGEPAQFDVAVDTVGITSRMTEV